MADEEHPEIGTALAVLAVEVCTVIQDEDEGVIRGEHVRA
jgi:hypothetical protein